MSIEIPNKINKFSDKITINNYTIIERIGVGSYGRIYKVKKENRLFVLKEIPIHKNVDNEKVESVKNEAEILSSLSNKYVVKYYESFTMSQNIYIVMEYCEKGDLCTYMTERLKNKKQNCYFTEDFIWKLFIQISIGLYYIHSKKIIHRDIKTLNIFLTKDFSGKIGDLGVAKVLDGTTNAITFIGTPYYVSPEMCQNKPYNEKSDIWALGCILYELITFRHPFTATNQAALFIKILHGNYTPLPENTSKDLVNMVKFILQKNYVKRPYMKDILTSKTFLYHAKRLGLENEVNEVISMQKTNTINSTSSSNNKVMSNRKLTNNIKKSQNLKIENNKSPLFANEEKMKRNKILKRENCTNKKIEKKIIDKNFKKEIKSIELTPRKNTRVKTREKKIKNNLILDNYFTNNSNKIIIESNNKEKNVFKFCSNSPKEKYDRKKILDESDSDLLSTSEFISILEKTKKNNPNKITLNDLCNFQFGPDENKLETASSTTSLLKLDNALLSISEMYLIYNSENNKNLCDSNELSNEIPENKKIQNKNDLIKNIPRLNYIDKIHQNKKEFEKIGKMKNFELIKNSEICKTEYEKCLSEIKKYSGIINLEKLRKSYRNIKNLTDEELNKVLEDMVIKIKQKLPKNKAEKIAEDLYNLIYYENKFELIKRTINKNN